MQRSAESDGGSGDFVCSPAGMWLALASVAAGARRQTADELRELLGVAEGEAARAVTDGARALAGTDALGVATRVWSRVPVLREYEEALPDIGFGPLDPDAADAWVREATDGMIERLPVVVTPDTLLLLVNALVLKARWEDPFEGAATRDAWVVDVGVGAGGGLGVGVGARVVEMRCAGRGGLPPVRVRFVLGEPGAGPAAVLPLAWAPRERRSAIDAEQISMALPRLSLRTRTDAADFSGMSPSPAPSRNRGQAPGPPPRGSVSWGSAPDPAPQTPEGLNYLPLGRRRRG
ncbi:serpin family protein [Streptomyces sp. NPDC093510]|uniref:serpin family protein n=1 Tax=Streptomyces sp. NPDC093510 TaxID=3155199 RepID=UPI0034363F88